MSTPFNVRSWAAQAGIQTTGGFAVIAECVTIEELERFAQIAIAQHLTEQARKNVQDAELAYEVNRLSSELSKWEASYNAVCDERDAIAKDNDKAHELLRWAETEMRYAGWDTRINDQNGRTDVYEAIVEFLK